MNRNDEKNPSPPAPSGGSTGKKPWGGRFAEGTDPRVEAFSASVHFDRALAHYDIRGSLAHTRMLAATGLVSQADAAAIEQGLEQIGREIEAGEFVFDPKLEDVHMNIEARLHEVAGPAAAGALHSGRSRNDQVATDMALYLRDACRAARRGLLELRGVLLERAAENIETILPGYTHMQRAQPVRLAHHWLAYVTMFGRDAERFRDADRRMRHCPLGAGAMATSTLPLDRAATARALGFDGPSLNSMDTVASRDAALEFLSAVAITLVNLSRLCEELVLWAGSEFAFIEMADAYSTGSSMMPQKKNPDVPELVRGKSGRAVGNLVSLLTSVKGLPLTYNRDLQEDKEPIFDSTRTLADCLEVTTGTLATLRVRADRMREAAADPMLLATDLAELLVQRGVPFREAHEVVGKIVGHCVREGADLGNLSRETLQGFHSAFPAGTGELLELERSLEARDLPGGTSRRRVEEALAAGRTQLEQEARELEALS